MKVLPGNLQIKAGECAPRPDTVPFLNERYGAVNSKVRRGANKKCNKARTFDSLDEAYDFYNLYSWEIGFDIRYGKSRLNAERTK